MGGVVEVVFEAGEVHLGIDQALHVHHLPGHLLKSAEHLRHSLDQRPDLSRVTSVAVSVGLLELLLKESILLLELVGYLLVVGHMDVGDHRVLVQLLELDLGGHLGILQGGEGVFVVGLFLGDTSHHD